jgi:hypothetical protein
MNSSWKYNRKYGRFFRKYSVKRQKVCTINKEIEAKSVNKTQRIEIDDIPKRRCSKINQTTKQKLGHEDDKNQRTVL